jgi:putative oxidoreductase
MLAPVARIARLVALGLLTRLAAFILVINLGVAFFLVHKASLAMGAGSGELAFVYLAGFVAVFLAGPGRFSLDSRKSLLFTRPQ